MFSLFLLSSSSTHSTAFVIIPQLFIVESMTKYKSAVWQSGNVKFGFVVGDLMKTDVFNKYIQSTVS